MTRETRPKRKSYFLRSEGPDANSVRYVNTTRRDFLKLAGGVSALAVAKYMSPSLDYALNPFVPKNIEARIQERLGFLTNPLPEVKGFPVVEPANQYTQMDGVTGSIGGVNDPSTVQKSVSSSIPSEYVECLFYSGDTITAPLVPDTITCDGQRSESAWDYAEVRDLTPGTEEYEGASGKVWILYNEDYLSLYIIDDSSHALKSGMTATVFFDTRVDGFKKTPYCGSTITEEDDFGIRVLSRSGKIFGYPADKAVPHLSEVKARVHNPTIKNDIGYEIMTDDVVQYEISIPLDTLTYYQKDQKLQTVGIKIGIIDYYYRLATFASNNRLAYLNFSEIEVPEMPPWALGAALVTGLAGASYVSSLINKRQY